MEKDSEALFLEQQAVGRYTLSLGTLFKNILMDLLRKLEIFDTVKYLLYSIGFSHTVDINKNLRKSSESIFICTKIPYKDMDLE